MNCSPIVQWGRWRMSSCCRFCRVEAHKHLKDFWSAYCRQIRTWSLLLNSWTRLLLIVMPVRDSRAALRILLRTVYVCAGKSVRTRTHAVHLCFSRGEYKVWLRSRCCSRSVAAKIAETISRCVRHIRWRFSQRRNNEIFTVVSVIASSMCLAVVSVNL